MADVSLHDVGPVYAVRDYMRRLERICQIPMQEDGEWYNLLLSIVSGKPSRCHKHFRNSLAKGLTSQRMLSVTETPTRKLGQPATEYVMLRADVGEIKHLGGMRSIRGIYACRDYVRIERQRAELVTSLPFVFFSAHALERIHERENCTTGEIDEAMRERMVTADGDLAFAAITGLMVRAENGVAHQLVPFGDGLLVATIVSYVSPAKEPVPTVMRQTFKHRTVDQRRTPIRAELVGTMPEGIEEHCSQVLTIARTYLSADMLRPEQEEYRRLYMDEAAAMDRGKLAAALHMPVAAHETRSLDGMTASKRLHELLALSVNHDAYPAIWEAEESRKDASPPETELKRTVLKLKRLRGAEQAKAEKTMEAEKSKWSKHLPMGRRHSPDGHVQERE